MRKAAIAYSGLLTGARTGFWLFSIMCSTARGCFVPAHVKLRNHVI